MLPSRKRPKEVEEEKAARVAAEKVEREKVVFRTSKLDIFKRTMEDWYTDLSNKQKKRVTPVVLKRKAVHVCYINDMIYDRLPRDWVTDLETTCKLKLYQRVKKKKDDNPIERKVAKSGHSRPGSSSELATDEGKRRRRAPSPSQSTASGSGSDSLPRPHNEDNQNRSVKEGKKRFLDLSTQAPPPVWLESYAKGIVLPRVLTIHSTEDTNILFYDYNPKLKDSFGREIKLTPQPRHNVNVLKELFCERSSESDGRKSLKKGRNKHAN